MMVRFQTAAGVGAVRIASLFAGSLLCIGEPVPGKAEEEPVAIDDEKAGLEQAPETALPPDDQIFEWSMDWKQGLQYQLKQKVLLPDYMPFHYDEAYRKLEGRLGVKLHIDAAVFEETGSIGDIPEDTELRRGRVYTLGNTHWFRPMDFKIEFGFSGKDFFFDQGYLRWNGLKWISTLQVGQFKAPMSLEMMESSGGTCFLERGSPVLAFAPGSRLGLQVGGPYWQERMTLTLGLFARVQGLAIGDATESATGPIARMTWLALNDTTENRERLLHLGASANYVFSRENAIRYRARPESFLAPHLVDTRDIAAENALLLGLEAAGVSGPLLLRGEVLTSGVSNDNGQRYNFSGAYAYAACLLTGESHPYSTNRGFFTRPRPRQPFSLNKRRWGAWEVAARASTLDLSDQDIRGGRMRNLSGGLNWYLTRDSRMMFNYVYADINDAPETGSVHILQTRLQLEF